MYIRELVPLLGYSCVVLPVCHVTPRASCGLRNLEHGHMMYYLQLAWSPCGLIDVVQIRRSPLSLSLVGRTRVRKDGSWTG